jgi:hypothetical protein
MAETKEKKKRQSKPISLKPYQLDEAVSDLLKVKPEQQSEKKLGKSENNIERTHNEP